MSVNFYKKQAFKRLCYALMIGFIYLLGCHLSLPGVDTQQFNSLLTQSPALAFALGITGLSLDQFSLFSLGLSPWMSALILWRILLMIKGLHLKSLTEAQSFRWKLLLTLSLGVIQSLGLLAQFGPIRNLTPLPDWMLVTFLITGLTILVWLGNLNAQYGLGGPTLLILISMVKAWPNKIITQLSRFSPDQPLVIIFSISAVIFSLYAFFLIFRFYQGERRIPLRQVLLDGTYATKTYFPIPTNPAGGMPFMYAFSIVTFPQYLFFLFGQKKTGFVAQLYDQMQLDRPLGIALLLLSLILLTYGFSYVNIDYKTIAEDLQKSGDYFDQVYPGKNTEVFLFHKISMMATIAAIFNTLIIGLPMIASLWFKSLGATAYLMPTLIVLMFLMRELVAQFQQAYHRNDYPSFLEEKKAKTRSLSL